MSYQNRRFFSTESVEEKTRKYTRPYPVVTSQLRNMQYASTVSWTPPAIHRGFIPSLMNTSLPPRIVSQQIVSPHLTLPQPIMRNQFSPLSNTMYNVSKKM